MKATFKTYSDSKKTAFKFKKASDSITREEKVITLSELPNCGCQSLGCVTEKK